MHRRLNQVSKFVVGALVGLSVGLIVLIPAPASAQVLVTTLYDGHLNEIVAVGSGFFVQVTPLTAVAWSVQCVDCNQLPLGWWVEMIISARLGGVNHETITARWDGGGGGVGLSRTDDFFHVIYRLWSPDPVNNGQTIVHTAVASIEGTRRGPLDNIGLTTVKVPFRGKVIRNPFDPTYVYPPNSGIVVGMPVTGDIYWDYERGIYLNEADQHAWIDTLKYGKNPAGLHVKVGDLEEVSSPYSISMNVQRYSDRDLVYMGGTTTYRLPCGDEWDFPEQRCDFVINIGLPPSTLPATILESPEYFNEAFTGWPEVGVGPTWGSVVWTATGLQAYFQIDEFNTGGGNNVTEEVSLVLKSGSLTTTKPKPGSAVEIAILTTNDFQFSDLDPISVRFGATGAEARPVSSVTTDANKDKIPDIVFTFLVSEIGLSCGATQVYLTGQSPSGDQDYHGALTVKAAKCK